MIAIYSEQGGSNNFKVSKVTVDYLNSGRRQAILIGFAAINQLGQCCDISMSLKEFDDFYKEVKRTLEHSKEGGCLEYHGTQYP